MSHFYIWRDRYRQDGLAGLRDGPRGPRHHPFTTPAHIVAIVALTQDVPAVRSAASSERAAYRWN